MSAKEILVELPQLSVEERAELLRALQEMAAGGEAAASAIPATDMTLRIAGLHEGAWEISDDFDAPLLENHEAGASPSVRDFFGTFASGDPHAANNERIDADLAREAAGGI